MTCPKLYKLCDGWDCVARSDVDFVNQLRSSSPLERHLSNQQYMQNFCNRHTKLVETAYLLPFNECLFVSSLKTNLLLAISDVN
jgi:hypothetical protein